MIFFETNITILRITELRIMNKINKFNEKNTTIKRRPPHPEVLMRQAA